MKKSKYNELKELVNAPYRISRISKTSKTHDFLVALLDNGRVYTGYYRGSGWRTTAVDYTGEICDQLNKLGIAYTTGNDAPRGGVHGNYVEITMPAFIKEMKKAMALRKAEEEARHKAEEEAKRKAEEEAKRKAEEARYRKFTNVKDCSPNGKWDKTIPYSFQFYALDFEKIRIRRHLLLPDEEYRCELIFVSEEGNVHWYDCRRLHFNPFTLEFDNGETHIEPSPESNEEWIVFKNPFHVESEWDDDDVNVFLGGGIDGRPIDERYFDWGLQDYDLISEKVPSELVCMPTILKFIRDNVEYIPVYKGF